MNDRPPEIASVDFSHFHPLDHTIWQCRTWAYNDGGWRRHLQLRWEYQWSPQVHRLILCRLRRHHYVKAWARGDDGELQEPAPRCAYCYVERG